MGRSNRVIFIMIVSRTSCVGLMMHLDRKSISLTTPCVVNDTPLVCCHQYLFQDGIFKLNDFNYARPIYMNKKTHESCTRENYGMLHWKGRSLEEHIKVLRLPFDPPVPDKIDVWMMGKCCYSSYYYFSLYAWH